MNSSITQQLQQETLNALDNFITQQNNESIAQNYTLVIIGNQVTILDNTIVQTEETTQNNNEENVEPPPYNEFDLLDEFLSLDTLNEENIILENNIEDTEQIISNSTNTNNKKNYLLEFQQDLKEITNNSFISSKPLIATTQKNQAIKIISCLKKGT